MPHALLFTGIEGVGREKAALTFAKACNCRRNRMPPESTPSHASDPAAEIPCGVCRSCRKIESGNHPDILHINPSGRKILIDQIRSLCELLTMKPYEADVRVVLISQAHTMNDSAANALLKMLEEPPDKTVLILTAPNTTDLLPTIASRCQHIRFNPISRETLTDILTSRTDLDPEQAGVVAVMANGSLTQALQMASADWVRQRDWLIKASGLDQPGKMSSAAISRLLAVAEILAQNRNNLLQRLEVLMFWIRDLIVYPHDSTRIINADRQDSISRAAGQLPAADLMSGFEAVQSAHKKLQSNSNVRLTLEDMFFKLAGLYSTVE